MITKTLEQCFALAIGVILLSSCGKQGWESKNADLVKKYNLKLRQRTIPPTDVEVKLDPGIVYDSKDLPKISIAQDVSATVAWDKGALLEQLEMGKDAVYPEQTMTGELIAVVQEGSGACVVDDKTLPLVKDSVLYLTSGMKRSIKAGSEGLKAIEVFSPVRLDHLNLAGVKLSSSAKVDFPDQGVKPSLAPATVYNLNEIQLAPLTKPDESQTYKRSSANSRLIWGKNVMLSFIRMDPNSSFPNHIHPEDQLMTLLRGAMVEGAVDATYPMSGEKRNVILLPDGMIHSGKMSELGADALDVFWPVRPDYMEYAKKQDALYHQVVAPDATPTKLADQFTFTEGPTWLKGKLYFSDMYFKDPKHGDWTGDPGKSRTIVMTPDGKWRILAQGMQTNGTIASKTGNLIVCDMFGHRVIEMDRNSGKVMRVLLDKVNGKPIDGPNDLVMDFKSGIYISDPQFTPEKQKSQPGTQVYYLAPDGSAKVVIPSGNYAMPNGVEISPDGKTFYVNNTWLFPGENFIWAYDIQADGSLENKRKFAVMNLTPEVLSASDPAKRVESSADGSIVDTDGRVYQATLSGLQIIDKSGEYDGTIWFPQYPVNCTFGGENYDQIYCVGGSSVWTIPTKVKGFRLPENMN